VLPSHLVLSIIQFAGRMYTQYQLKQVIVCIFSQYKTPSLNNIIRYKSKAAKHFPVHPPSVFKVKFVVS